MVIKVIKLIILASTILFASQSFALIELRAGFNFLLQDDLDSSIKLDNLKGFHLDIVVNPPLVPLGVGLRYEQMSSKGSLGGNVLDVDFDRFSILVNKRWFSTILFVGPIGVIGLKQGVKTKIGSNKDDYKNGLTFAVGLEAGVKLPMFLAGAEVAYNIGELETASGSNFDLKGLQGKIFIGCGF